MPPMQQQIFLLNNLKISSYTISYTSNCSPAYGFIQIFHFRTGHEQAKLNIDKKKKKETNTYVSDH